MQNKEENWYKIEDIDRIDTPALAVYVARAKANITLAKTMIGDIERLRPHVKTFKSVEATRLLIAQGISKFKCATIAEAEMLVIAGASDVLLAYQPIGPKLERFLSLLQSSPDVKFSCLVDNVTSAEEIAFAAKKDNLEVTVYLDLNVGMNRTGIAPGKEALALYEFCMFRDGLLAEGLHVYDGHIKDADLEVRKEICDTAFSRVEAMKKALFDKGFPAPKIVAGGSTTFPIHAKRKNVICSPGTFIYWDQGYQKALPEQKFAPAALVISRVISLPDPTKICLDLGHKSIASENSLPNRVHFLNAPELTFIGQSEEHLVAEVPAGHTYKVGDVFYGLPYHICPTCALYEKVITIESRHASGEWRTVARDRKMSF